MNVWNDPAFDGLLPGTAIRMLPGVSEEDALSMTFISGGLTLSQLCTLGKTEWYNVQNWVRRGFVSHPVGKKYSKSQFCRIVSINLLGGILPIPDIVSLLSFVNGRLNDESDDIIGDDDLYLLFVRSLRADDGETLRILREDPILAGKNAEDEEKIVRAVSVMRNAYLSSLYQREALNELARIEKR